MSDNKLPLLRHTIGNLVLFKSLCPLNTIGSLLCYCSATPIGNSDTSFMASFGGSDTASIIGPAILPTIKVAILERVALQDLPLLRGCYPLRPNVGKSHLLIVNGHSAHPFLFRPLRFWYGVLLAQSDICKITNSL